MVNIAPYRENESTKEFKISKHKRKKAKLKTKLKSVSRSKSKTKKRKKKNRIVFHGDLALKKKAITK